jgi:CheY-like chemotaxis protein
MTPSLLRAVDHVEILVADPDHDWRKLYRESFDDAGEHVIEVLDGRDALVRALAKPPSLIITELELPFIDGIALCEIVRQDRATSRVPIAVVTSATAPAQIERARRAGANAVLSKPTPFAMIRLETRRLLVHAQDTWERAQNIREKSVVEMNRALALLAQANALRPPLKLSKAHQRFDTTTPPSAPPALVCPVCDDPLAYEHSHVGGVSALNAEQWDYYCCGRCGPFQYRQRTRKLRRIS